MKLGNRLPQLSLVVAGTEVYPLIVREVTRRVVSRRDKDAGSADIEDFLSEAVTQVLTSTKRRYSGRTRVTTFIFKRIGGSFLDMMRREMRYESRYTLEAECPEGNMPEVAVVSDVETQVSNALLWAKVRHVMRTALTPLHREILLRHYFHGENFKAIAESLWVETDQCKVLHGAALQEIRRHFPSGAGFGGFVS